MNDATMLQYQFIKKLGQGGMGEVYLVEDTKLHRQIALKVVPPHYSADPDFKARFYREAQAAAALNHPNIITIYDVGEYKGRAFIAMEYVRGESLRELIEREKLPVPQVIDIVRQICAGLQEAHRAGIIHRDLKPANILLTAEKRVKIVDFGLAKVQGVSRLTKSGIMMGTVPYMSPEQVKGEELDARSDIFSLGIILYELLTRDLPFQGESEFVLMSAIASQEPRPLALYLPDLTPGLQNLINKALTKDRKKRYQRIEELAVDLQNLVEAENKIKNYRLLDKLESGGMGEIYLAEDQELGRKVVLKFLPPQYNTDPEFKIRLKREAKAAAALNHPNIITIYEVGEYQGRAYIAMEYVEGESLKNKMTREMLPLREALDYMQQTCAGLCKAHRAGLVHRDIKPANILVNLDGQVKLIDFGLAKVKGVSKLTKAGTMMGTVPYMSPEQVKGEELDARSDIFSLGVVFYELLTGSLPFQGESEFTVMNAIANKQPLALSQYKLKLPTGLEKIVDKALAKDLKTRYQRVEEIQADLKNIKEVKFEPPPRQALPDETIAIERESQIKRSWFVTSLPRPRVVLITLAAAVLVVLAWFLVPALKKGNGSSPPSVASGQTMLKLQTQPPGATVLLNSDSLGVTPLNRPVDKAGSALLSFRKRDYFTRDTNIVLQKGAVIDLTVMLRPAARVSIFVEPLEAAVQLNGESIEPSRLAGLQLPVGQYNLRIAAAGYETKQERLGLRPGDNGVRRYALTKSGQPAPATGGLSVDSQPRGASVILSGARVGDTPYQIKNLAPGRYPVSVSLEGYETYSGTVVIRPGQVTSLSESLQALVLAVGQLSIKSNPAGATVLMDGEVVGTTPYENEETPAGAHEIVLRKKGYKDLAKSVNIVAEQLGQINEKLVLLIGKLNVLVKPYGNIYVDGVPQQLEANFLVSLDFPVGPHKLKVEHPSFGTYEKMVEIEEAQTTDIRIDFNRQFKLTVTSFDATGASRIWGNIYVDGKPIDANTPQELTLRMGLHKIEVRREGYVTLDAVKTINLENNLIEPLMFRLKKRE